MIQPQRPPGGTPAPETGRRRDRSRCPTCGASRSGRAQCHRCGSDLSSLLEIEARAESLLEQALEAYDDGRFHTASTLAAESARLLAQPVALCLLACARLRAGDYPGALAARARLDEDD